MEEFDDNIIDDEDKSSKQTFIDRFLYFFKERQIYHRSDGVVHFVTMSTSTQIALAIVLLAALLWVAYSSVNIVFARPIHEAQRQQIELLESENKLLIKLLSANSDSPTISANIPEHDVRLATNINKDTPPVLARPVRATYNYFIETLDYVEPNHQLNETEKLNIFAGTVKWVLSGLAIGFSGAVGTIFLRAKQKKEPKTNHTEQ